MNCALALIGINWHLWSGAGTWLTYEPPFIKYLGIGLATSHLLFKTSTAL